LTPDEFDSVQHAADLQAATIAADKAALQKTAADKAATDAAGAGDTGPGYAPGNAPSGTPIPLHLDNDPNPGSYGQMVIVNLDAFCASHGGTTRSDGAPVCL